MRFTSLLVLIVLVGFLAIGTTLHDSSQIEKEYGTILNFTESKLNITDSINLERRNISIEDTQELVNVDRIVNIMFSYVDFLVLAMQEVAKIGIEFGYTYPAEYDKLFKIITVILIVIVIVALIKPLVYLVGLIIIFFMWLFDMKRRKRNEQKSTT